jgi:hypothetical protein
MVSSERHLFPFCTGRAMISAARVRRSRMELSM